MRIKSGIFLCVLMLCCLSAEAQVLERKIIIEDSQFYYVTVDDNYQIGTLYSGNVAAKIGEAKAYAVPAGRGLSNELNPLAWDIRESEMYAINFLDHSLNDRNESIKKFEVNELKPWSTGIEIGDLIMESIDQHTYAVNQPFLFVKQRSKYLNHFHFDAIVEKGNFWMVMTNNDELTIWKYAGEEWEASAVQTFKINGFFNLFLHKGKVHLMTQQGAIFEVNLKGMKSVQMESPTLKLEDVILVEDRDNEKIFYLKSGQINYEKSLKELMDEAAIELL